MKFANLFGRYKVFIGGIILLCIAAAPSIYYFQQYQKAQLRIANPSLAAKQDAQETIARVGKLMLLPTGEEPTVLQITDVTKLKDQAFFTVAENGDRVLIYTNAKKAILYRSDVNKVVDVAPITVASTASATPQVATGSATGKSASPSATKK